ncbi:MAG TPA: citrate/2-methylcitrate synthase [Chloroflexia bacterium]|nr:citrate/2-methylcitrate synthase [Chloroflexia bacterium]
MPDQNDAKGTAVADAAQKKEDSNGARPKGLEGIVIGSSSISLVEGTEGRLSYRGYQIQDLAGNSSFEEVFYLLINGELPNRQQLTQFEGAMKARRELPEEAMAVLRVLPKSGQPIDVLRTVVSSLALIDEDVDNTQQGVVIDKAITLAARMPTIVAAYDRLRRGEEPVAPNQDLGHAANLLYMLNGTQPSDEDASALNTYFVLAAEHSFNASTFTAKVVISTLSDYYSGIVGAISSLKGAAHGGANQKAMEMMIEVGDVNNVDTFIDHALATKRRLMGMGHRIYKTYDPRAAQLNEHARIVADRSGNSKWYEIAHKIDAISHTHPYFSERKIYPNVEFYSAPLLYTLGFQPDMMPALFACSRISGWTAHILEQLQDNRIIRPNADYVGPSIRKYEQLSERK